MHSANNNVDPGNGTHVRATLALAWSFVLFNYIYADIGTFAVILMRAELLARFQSGAFGSVHLTKWFMLAAAVLMEIPISMVLLSWILSYRTNRIANLLAGTLMTLVILLTLFGAGTVPQLNFYTLYEVIEIAATATIVWYAWRWRDAKAASSTPA
jgi:hypothetical protein